MMLTRRKASSALVIYVGIVASILCSMTKNAHALAESGKSTVQAATQVRREHSLDHWDSDTLAYYLDNYSGYDAAIMFYANWDTNSHQLAPYWNDIAVKMDAGTTQSKLIMVSGVIHSDYGYIVRNLEWFPHYFFFLLLLLCR